MTVEQISRSLRIHYYIMVAIALLLVGLYEGNLLPIGSLSSDKLAEAYLSGLMVLTALIGIPASLKMFSWTHLADKPQETKLPALLHLGHLRLLILSVQLCLDTLFHYLFIHASFGYLAIILLFASIFVYPSLTRCKSDIGA